ncbi:hypothetical protein ACF08N_22910 [Streptomyces sp. NPDC015127]|uniref:hypothetical protein n=1 Tax=Streptomyces sp. NPDC015127 TaxID=3364939 RepID=UPI0036F5E47F
MGLRIGPLEPVNDEDILVVYGYHQRRQYPEFDEHQVYSIHALAFMKGVKPKRAFHTGLGLSREADRMRRELTVMEAVYGTKIHHVDELYIYDEEPQEVPTSV